MDRVRFAEHRGHRYVLLDFEGIKDPRQAVEEARLAKEFFARQTPDGSLRTLTNVLNTVYNGAVIEAFKDLTSHNRPFVKAAAVVTNSGLHRVAITTVSLFSKRKLQAFGDVETARDWLTQQ